MQRVSSRKRLRWHIEMEREVKRVFMEGRRKAN